MNFMGVGPAELVVILVVALVFVGPERLPRLAADIARTIREIRKYTGALASEFTEIVQDLEKETEGERGQWKEIGEGLASATQSVTDVIRGARADAETAGTTPSPAAPEAAANGAQAADPAPTNGAAEHWVNISDAPPAPPAPEAIVPRTNGTPGKAPAETQEAS